MQHFYSDIKEESYFSFEDVYRRAVQRFPSGATFVEVGVLHGQSLAFLAVEIVNSGKQIQLIGVDNFEWHDGQLATVVKNLQRPGLEFIRLIKAESHKAAEQFADKSVEFVFLDACHEYEYIAKDIDAWLPKIKQGGMISGHDYDKDSFPGVVKAVDERFGNRVRFSDWTVWEVDV